LGVDQLVAAVEFPDPSVARDCFGFLIGLEERLRQIPAGNRGRL
jgi:hypothetical protein